MLTSLLFDNIISKTDSAAIRFSKKHCLRSRFNGNECRACLEECKPGALGLHGRDIVFDQHKCTNCMRCVSTCPNNAFGKSVNVTHLLETVRNVDQVVLTCKQHAHFQQNFTIPCIGILSESLLAAMITVANNDFFINLSHCSDCINAHCLTSFHQKMQNIISKFAGSGGIPLKYITENDTIHPADKGISRRCYLGFAKKTLVNLSRRPGGNGQTDTITSLAYAGKGPAMNSMALHYAYKNSAKDDKSVLLSYFYTVTVTEHCNVCPGCQGMCPTGALKRTSVKGEKRLMFTSSACSGCGLCQEFCKKKSIKVIRGVAGDPGQPLRLCQKKMGD